MLIIFIVLQTATTHQQSHIPVVKVPVRMWRYFAFAASGLLSLFRFGGDKVSMLTHTYPHKPLRKIKVNISSHHGDSPLYVWPDV